MGTTYTVIANPGNITATSSTSPVVVPGLTNGVEYTFIIKATNELGESGYSLPHGPILIGGVPTVPLNFSVTSPTRYELEISFDPPASNGGVTIDNYVITITPGPIEILTTTEPYTQDSLADDVLYSVTVKAHNAKGFGPATSPQTCWAGLVPDAPTIGDVTLETDTTVAVEFTPPADDGGPAITQYTATSTPGSISNTGTGSPIFVAGLDYDTDYTFHVHATNAIGNSAASDESASILTGPTVPDAPVLTSTSDGLGGQVTVYWNLPDDNGSAITYFYVNRYVGGSYTYQSFVAGPSATSLQIASAVGVEATFKVYASNAIGDSALSNESNPVTPYGGVPAAAPTGVTAQSGLPGYTFVNFTPVSQQNDGGYRIQCYKITTSDGKIATQNTGSSVIVSTWSPTGGPKTLSVRAVNEIGEGPASSNASFTVANPSIPYRPGPPTITSAASNPTGQITVYFNAPSQNGGGPGISSYTVEAYRAGYTGPYGNTGSSSPITVSGLVSGAHYRVAVAAYNAGSGFGAQCDMSADIVVL